MIVRAESFELEMAAADDLGDSLTVGRWTLDRALDSEQRSLMTV